LYIIVYLISISTETLLHYTSKEVG